MANENQIPPRNGTPGGGKAGGKPCPGVNGVILRRIVLGGCVLFWVVVMAMILA